MTALNAPAQIAPQERASGSDPPPTIIRRASPRHAAPDNVMGAHPVGALALTGLRLSLGFLDPGRLADQRVLVRGECRSPAGILPRPGQARAGAGKTAGYLGNRWANLKVVQQHAWLR